MKHLDEHTIELYILGSELVKEQIGELEAHLKECHGCRSLAEQMKVFYEKAENELETSHHILQNMTDAIVRKQANIELSNETFWSPVHYPEKSLLAKFWYFVYRHPIPATIGGFTVVVALALMINSVMTPKLKDTNTMYFRYNTTDNFLDVYDVNNEVLWREPSVNLGDLKNSEDLRFISYTMICDLNDDGTNEIITTLPNVNDKNKLKMSLRVLDASGHILWYETFNPSFNYKNEKFSQNFNSGAIIVDHSYKSGENEVFVTANNWNRSPFFLARFDKDGKEVGKYWHYGYLPGMYTIDVNGDSINEIILCGENNALHSANEEFSTVIVLDPRRIIGDAKSTQSPGFGWNYSDAELFYIRFPHTDLNKQLNLYDAILRMENEGNGEIFFLHITNDRENKAFAYFYFYFTLDMRIQRVKPDKFTIKEYASLVKEGKLNMPMDDMDSENLKKKVQYWDGKNWKNEWTMVKHEKLTQGN